MAIFETNTLKQEEELGGFIPGQDGDDAFLLEKLDGYGGILPEFEFKDEAVSNLLLEKEGLADQIKDKNAAKELAQKKKEEQETTQAEESTWGQDYTPPEEESFVDEDNSFAESAFGGAAFDSQDDEGYEDTSDAIFDPELMRILKEEEERTADRRKQREEKNGSGVDLSFLGYGSNDSSSQRSGDEYVSPFGDLPEFIDHPEVLSFDEIKADKPSKLGLKEVGSVNFENETQEEKPNKKEKKKRSMPLWQLISISAAAALVLISGIIWGIFKFITNPEEPKKPSTNKISQVKPVPAPPKEVTADVDTTENIDLTTNTDSNSEGSSNGDDDEGTHSTDNPKGSNSTNVHTIEETHSSTKGTTSKPGNKENSHSTEPKPVAIPKPNKHSKSDNHDITHKTATKKEKPSNKVSKENNKEIKKSKSSDFFYDYSYPPKIEGRTDNPVYVVQIYASPSKEDAEDWVEKLKRAKASNVKMDNQKIRGQNWYRVRFGSFTTKEEAKETAIKFGYPTSWIDRIK